MAENVGNALSAGDLALQVAEFIMGQLGNKAPGPMERPDLARLAATIPPLDDWDTWAAVDDGFYSLSYGSFCITRPYHGIGLTVDPHEPAHFRIESLNDGWVSISLDDRFIFAGDQATVKTGKQVVKNWERFMIRKTVIEGITLCTILCKRDGEYWYIDEQGMVRHRNRKEKGRLCHVFAMKRH